MMNSGIDWYKAIETAVQESNSGVIFVNMNDCFGEMFQRRVYGEKGLYSYELEWIFEQFFKDIGQHTRDKNFTKMVVYIENERAPNFIQTLPILDRIQELYPSVEIICVHSDWKEYESRYIKIPSHIWAHEAVSGIQPHAGAFIDLRHNLTQEYFIQSNDIERNKLFLCTNKTRRYHKDELINFIRQNNLEDKGMISVRWENITLEN